MTESVIKRAHELIFNPFKDRYQYFYEFSLIISIILYSMAICLFSDYELAIFWVITSAFGLDIVLSRLSLKRQCQEISDNLTHLTIKQGQIRSAAFSAKLFNSWILAGYSTQSGRSYGLYEGRDINRVYKKALDISASHSIPIEFDCQQYWTVHNSALSRRNEIASQPPLAAQQDGRIVVTHNRNGTTIQTRWTLLSYARMFLKILQIILKSTYFIVFINILSFIGALCLNFLIFQDPLLHIGENLQNLGDSLNPNRFLVSNVVDFLEIGTISFILLSNSLNISIDRIIQLSTRELKYYMQPKLSRRKRFLGALQIKDMELFLFDYPRKSLVMVDADHAIEVSGLQTMDELEAVVHGITHNYCAHIAHGIAAKLGDFPK